MQCGVVIVVGMGGKGVRVSGVRADVENRQKEFDTRVLEHTSAVDIGVVVVVENGAARMRGAPSVDSSSAE